ncbi:MAG: sigma 54-interacting transcriptional regulator [Nitrospirota bacterium]|nr:sigma 54-interacting transcriptional regulator [Nitrospirota bacterium]
MAEKPGSLTAEPGVDRYGALLEVTEAIAAHRDLAALCRDLARRLPAVVRFEYVGFLLHDPSRNVMRVHVLETSDARTLPSGMELPVAESAGGWVWAHQQPLIVPCLKDETRFPKGLAILRDIGVASLGMFPLTTAVRRLGAMGFGSLKPCAFGDAELAFLEQITKQVAVAVDNVLNHEAVQASQQHLARERDRLKLLLDVNNAVVSHLEFRDVFAATAASLRRVLPNDYTSLALHEPEGDRFRLYALDFPVSKGLLHEGMVNPVEGTPAGVALRSEKPQLFGERELRSFAADFVKLLLAEGIKSVCCVPLRSRNRQLGTLNIASLRPGAFTQDDVDLLTQVASQIAIAVENALAYRQIAELKDKLSKEKLYLEGEIQNEYNFEEIVGDGPALRRVLQQVEIVAPTDSTVLILGETGTGKELLARALHNRSGRRDRTFVKMNCAAIPSGLLESELFGHEKGAFTGAIATKVGRFELADGGTLFLDEVGDIPLELQSKLLRVLQEQEFERLGSNRTIRVNVRLVAATNRDLAQMVAEKQFRSDLYYRLNVFPLTVPPLRERREDIPSLVRYFAQKFARRMNKRIETIPGGVMTALSRYHWPGNVRELENLIERAVILSRGADLHVPLAELKAAAKGETQPVATLEDAERDHILRALTATDWVIGGPTGAAAKLGMKRTTLQSKIQKLRISRPR